MNAGLGRTAIAKALNITDWKARMLIREAVASGVENAKPGPKVKRPIPTVTKVVVKEVETIPYDAPVVTKRKMDGERVIVFSDIHLPYSDLKALSIALNYTKDAKPDHIVLNGDIADFYAVSSFQKNMEGRPSFEEEISETVRFFRELRAAHPDAKISFVCGNHEFRISKYLEKNAPELIGDLLSLPNLFKLKEMDIEYYDTFTPLRIGKLLITHSELVRKAAGSSARGNRDKYNSSVLIGHIHRGSIARQRVLDGQHVMVENPCLSKLDVDYMKFPDWLQGFTELTFDSNGDFDAHTHAIVDYKLITPSGDVYSIG